MKHYEDVGAARPTQAPCPGPGPAGTWSHRACASLMRELVVVIGVLYLKGYT